MDTSVRHFHVTSTSANGVLYYESEYESAEKSIEDFFGVITNIFLWQMDETITDALSPSKMLEAAYDEEVSAVWVGPSEGNLRVFWVACDGACSGAKPGRN